MPSSHDGSVFPRTYRLRLRYRVLFVLFGAGLLGSAAFLALHERRGLGLAVLAAILAAFGGVVLALVRTSRLVLAEDSLTAVEFYGTRRVRRADIAGRRFFPGQHGVSVVRLVDARGRTLLDVSTVHESDDALAAWLASLPDVDVEDGERALRELAAAAGESVEAFAARLAEARRLSDPLNGAALAVAIWGISYPRPYAAVLATLATILFTALLLLGAGRGLYAVNAAPTEPRPALSIALLLPALVLALRALLDVHLLDPVPLLVPGTVGGGIALAWILGGDPAMRRQWVLAAFVAVVLGAGTAGGAAALNVLLDRAPPRVVATRVVANEMSVGARRTARYLVLAPWGPRREAARVQVGRALYAAARPGAPVRVRLHPGALRMPWFDVALADRAAAPAARDALTPPGPPRTARR